MNDLLGYLIKKCRGSREDVLDSVQQRNILCDVVANGDEDLSVTVIFQINGSSSTCFSHRPLADCNHKDDNHERTHVRETTLRTGNSDHLDTCTYTRSHLALFQLRRIHLKSKYPRYGCSSEPPKVKGRCEPSKISYDQVKHFGHVDISIDSRLLCKHFRQTNTSWGCFRMTCRVE